MPTAQDRETRRQSAPRGGPSPTLVTWSLICCAERPNRVFAGESHRDEPTRHEP